MLHTHKFVVHSYLDFWTVHIHAYVETHPLWQTTDRFFDNEGVKLCACSEYAKHIMQ